ncbi:hypothetical protein Tco_1313813 [Tanacetum coccineum]
MNLATTLLQKSGADGIWGQISTFATLWLMIATELDKPCCPKPYEKWRCCFVTDFFDDFWSLLRRRLDMFISAVLVYLLYGSAGVRVITTAVGRSYKENSRHMVVHGSLAGSLGFPTGHLCSFLLAFSDTFVIVALVINDSFWIWDQTYLIVVVIRETLMERLWEVFLLIRNMKSTVDITESLQEALFVSTANPFQDFEWSNVPRLSFPRCPKRNGHLNECEHPPLSPANRRSALSAIKCLECASLNTGMVTIIVRKFYQCQRLCNLSRNLGINLDNSCRVLRINVIPELDGRCPILNCFNLVSGQMNHFVASLTLDSANSFIVMVVVTVVVVVAVGGVPSILKLLFMAIGFFPFKPANETNSSFRTIEVERLATHKLLVSAFPCYRSFAGRDSYLIVSTMPVQLVLPEPAAILLTTSAGWQPES